MRPSTLIACLSCVLAAACTQEPAEQKPAAPAPAPVAAAPAPAPAQPAPAVLQGLKVRLHGSMISADPSRSTALVSLDDAPARELKVGDAVVPGAVIVMIQPDSITLRAGEERRVVALDSPKKSAPGAAAPPVAAAAPTSLPPGMAPAPAPLSPPATGQNVEDAFRNALRAHRAAQEQQGSQPK